jgi:hypothetical protein
MNSFIAIVRQEYELQLALIIRGAMPIEAQPLRSEGKAGLP